MAERKLVWWAGLSGAVLVLVACLAFFFVGRRARAGHHAAEDEASGASSTGDLDFAPRPSTQASEHPAAKDGGPRLDRERADRIRAALREMALRNGVDDVTRTRAARPAAAAPYPEMPTGLDADGGMALATYIQSVVREDYFPLAKQCYQTAVKAHPRLKGLVALNLVIVGDTSVGGVVESAEFDEEQTTLGDPQFQTCLRESMLSVSFDAPPGGKVTVTYPIAFDDGE